MITQTKCKFANGVICEREKEQTCADCPVWNKVTDKVCQDLDICPVCGADRKVCREELGEEHVCFAGGN